MEAQLENGAEGLSSEDSHTDINQHQEEEAVNGALSPVSNGTPVDNLTDKEHSEPLPVVEEKGLDTSHESSGKEVEAERAGRNDESAQGDRRMSLRPRSTPKKYNDIPEIEVEEDRRRSKPRDRLSTTELMAQRKQSSSTMVIQMNPTSAKGVRGTPKTPKVTRPPPELLKAPIRQLSSSTSVTVVSKPKDSQSGLVLVNTQSPLTRKSGTSLVPASVTVSTVSSPSRSTSRSAPAPRQKTTPAPSSSSSPAVVDLYDKLGLSDDSYIVEAPSFVVPYLIEKTGEKELKKSLQSLQDSEKPPISDPLEQQEEQQDDKEKKSDIEESAKQPSESSSSKTASDEPPVSSSKPEEKEKDEEDYFSGAIGKFFLDIGLSLVQEYVQEDLLRIQKRKVSKGKKISDPSLRVPALEKNLEMTRSKNAPLKIKLRQCDRCNFRSESSLALAHHWSSPLSMGSGPLTKYVCQLCDYEAGDMPHVALHIQQEHQLRPVVEPDLSYHQCPLCPFEDAIKGKVSRHVASCQKRFIPQKNLEPPVDWEPPAKIPRLPARGLQAAAVGLNSAALGGAAVGGKGAVPFALPSYHLLLPKSAIANQAAAAASPGYRILPNVQGQPGYLPSTSSTPRGLKASSASLSGMKLPNELQVVQNAQARAGLPFATKGSSLGRQANASAHSLYSQAVYQQLLQAQGSAMSILPSTSTKAGGLASGLKKSSSAISLVPGLVSNKGLSIQGTSSPAGRSRTSQQPSISITPLPRSSSTPSSGGGKNSSSSSSAPATPASSKATGKNSISCEICDGVIKDMEQLRHHMQWIHKVKIHPKMIHNRPPLNCQKCQSRFFTDQGLERHLLGSHGLVTSSMQEAANRGQDGGRCPICGKVHQWKLLSHVVKDHGLTLKPAHLSYKCTVCTATFGMYKLFETHVYTAHSVVARKVLDKDKDSGKDSKTASAPLRINDEITIIPQPTGDAEQAVCRLCTSSYDLAEAKRQLRKLQNAGCSLLANADKSCASCLKKMAKKEDRQSSKVDIIDLSDDEGKNVSLPKSQVTITKVPAASKGEPPEKRPKT